jgi:predicted nucleic acid-binding protein
LIVVDASAVLEMLLRTDKGYAVEGVALDVGQRLHAPELLDVEVAQALRRLLAHRQVGNERATTALGDFMALPIERHPHSPLLKRIWELRATVSAYDGAYVALAEAMATPVLTCDGRLAHSHGHRAAVVLI